MCLARLMVLAASLSAAAGCGDDKPDRLSTGVDGNKPLGTVTPSEAQSICNATSAWSSQAIDRSKQQQLTCRVSSAVIAGLRARVGAGVTDAELQATCQTAYDRCIMTPPMTTATPAAPSCSTFGASCTATVSEYETCLNDLPPFLDQSLAMVPSCQMLNNVSIVSVINIPNTLPPSCKTFQMKCPGISVGGLAGGRMP